MTPRHFFLGGAEAEANGAQSESRKTGSLVCAGGQGGGGGGALQLDQTQRSEVGVSAEVCHCCSTD